VLEPLIPFSLVWLDRLLFGIALIIVLIVRPQGILPDRPTPAIQLPHLRKIIETIKQQK
jgi:ABC-type branched-subunit amino acid transport system permease subunit